nr:hypothetical protein [Kibdelosporangium sp. MJ126-NF4]CTQ89256.1 hypothetical protein [Kibdelosporangium sp. MJ126-NF4]
MPGTPGGPTDPSRVAVRTTDFVVGDPLTLRDSRCSMPDTTMSCCEEAGG